jgi:ATP-dependent helicase HrpA
LGFQLVRIAYPEELPITRCKAGILAALAAHQVVVVSGETGSGKSTQLPKMCLEAGRGTAGMIGHTQPRRIAARSVAERVAEELGTVVGEEVGYKVRFTDALGGSTVIKLMTDGILLAELHSDPRLAAYDTLIIDEAHERSLNIDFVLGYLKRLLPTRPGLKVLVTSATIDTERFSRHFSGAPVIEVPGRSWPVELRYRPWAQDAEGTDEGDGPEGPMDEVTAVCEAILELGKEPPGDVLVFLAGEREIRDTAEALSKLASPGTEILPLYGRLPVADQQRIFAPHTLRRVVLATNVAETSLTVPGIRYVVDAGTARVSRYSRRTKVQRLPIEPVSQASANQRAGRCGRLGPGICIRLYSEEDFASRPKFTEPEILRTNLASVVLQMASIGLGEPEGFPFIDPPDRRSIEDSIALLEALGAFAPARAGERGAPMPARITDLGRRLASLPLDPRLGRMVVEAGRLGCLEDVLPIATGLSVGDPRERPAERREAALALHGRFDDTSSDFVSLLLLWRYLEERQAELSSAGFRRMCRREMISYQRAREWQDVHAQLLRLCRQLRVGQGPTAPRREDWRARVHQAVLSGVPTQVGRREGDRPDYAAPRGARFLIWPGSVLAKKRPRWVMAAELVETGRLWARTAALVKPQWVERAASHLLSWSEGEPAWDRERAEAFVLARASLHGLVVVPARRKALARSNPKEAREAFVRHGLVEGDWEGAPSFVTANICLLGELRALSQRARQQLAPGGEEALFRFYDARVPAGATSGASFKLWLARERPVLEATAEDLVGRSLSGELSGFPDEWHLPEGWRLVLSYKWSPGDEDDGVTVEVPLSGLAHLGEAGLEWQVPGFREELVEALLRSLPKGLRRHLVPVGARARDFVGKHSPAEGPLLAVLADAMSALAGTSIAPSDFDWSKVPAYLRPTVAVRGPGGEVLAKAKDIGELLARLRPLAQRALVAAASSGQLAWGPPGQRMTSWEVGTLPRVFETEWHGWCLRGWPALFDEGDAVSVQVFEDEAAARLSMAAATRRLIQLCLPEAERLAADLERLLPRSVRLAVARLDGLGYKSARELAEDAAAAAIDAVVAAAGGPAWDAEGFSRLTERVRHDGGAEARRALAGAAGIISQLALLSRRAAQLAPRALPVSREDIASELAFLAGPCFLSRFGTARLPDLERYLAGLGRRLDKLAAAPGRDAELAERARAAGAEVEAALDRGRELGLPAEALCELGELRWVVEELRVSLFAQQLGTKGPVSGERLSRAIGRLLGEG